MHLRQRLIWRAVREIRQTSPRVLHCNAPFFGFTRFIPILYRHPQEIIQVETAQRQSSLFVGA